MSQTKTKREKKRQFGQFLTPCALAQSLIAELPLTPESRVLEPSMGDGSFVVPLVEAFMALHDGPTEERLARVLTQNVYGIEIDAHLYKRCLERIACRWGPLPAHHNLVCADFFKHWFRADAVSSDLSDMLLDDRQRFDFVVGNPPFGGTIDPAIQDDLDRVYGFRHGCKIKKETYSFFIVKSVDLLRPAGRLLFLCSDTFLTIPTMRGLRRLLMTEGSVAVETLRSFSDETNHPIVKLDLRRGARAARIVLNGEAIPYAAIEKTGNSSWTVTEEFAEYFDGPTLSQYVVASSGMTVGANNLFVREIRGGVVREPYAFEFFDDPITLARELERARLGKLSMKKMDQIRTAERRGETRRNVRWIQLQEPLTIRLPHPDYRYYNKACPAILFAEPTHAIYWKDDGDAVLTFKKNGNWYLHGVGGKPFFGREGITWQLIAPRLNARYLPPGYILDSGAPCAFLRAGVDANELYFLLGWMLSPVCNAILKQVLNHTRNIQSKDIERLPYPHWVEGTAKERIVRIVRDLVRLAAAGEEIGRDDPRLGKATSLFRRSNPAVRKTA